MGSFGNNLAADCFLGKYVSTSIVLHLTLLLDSGSGSGQRIMLGLQAHVLGVTTVEASCRIRGNSGGLDFGPCN